MNPIEESIYQYINNIIEISEEQEPLLIQYCRMFSAVITGSFYVLDISKKRFIYIKPDDLLLCGYSVKEAMKLNFDLFPLIIHPEDLSLWNNFLEIIPQHLQALHEKRNEIDHISCTVRLIRKNSYTKDPLSQVLYQRMIPVWKNEKISYLICSVESVAYKKNGFYLHLFYIISKQDGRLIKEIHIPYDKKKTSLIINKEQTKSARPRNEEFVPFHDSWILMDHSSDTIYRVFTDKRVVPFIARTPSIQSMGTEIFLYPSVLTDRYYFMQTVKKVYDFSSRVGLPRTDLMYDMKENIIYEYSLYNADYVHKEFVSLGYGGIAFINKEIAFVKTLEAPDLVDAYKNGNLKGKLKEIAASLDEESNPVLMIAKYKQKK